MNASPLSDEELIEHLAASPFASLLQVDLKDWALRQNRGNALKLLEERYSAYAAAPSPKSIRRAFRALLECCRLFDLTGRHARLFAELGRVDDEAPASVQLSIKRRGDTQPIREKRNRDAKRRRRSLTEAQEFMFFLRVGSYREATACGLPAAFKAVANCEDAASYTDGDLARRSVATVRASWEKWVKRYRDKGITTVKYGPETDIRSFTLRKPGRPKK